MPWVLPANTVVSLLPVAEFTLEGQGVVDAGRVSSGLHRFLLGLYGGTSFPLPRSCVVTPFLPPPNLSPSQPSATPDTGVLSRGTGITKLLCGSNHGAVASMGKSLRKSSCYW